MASQAIIAKALAVFGHKGGVALAVAIGTARLRKGQVFIGMAILALEGTKAQAFVLFKRESGLFMWKIGPVQNVDRIVTPAMVCVTGFAVGHRPEHAVESLSGAHVVAFLRVTCQAPVRHVLAAERQRVAGCTFPFKVSVGCHTLQRFSFGVARAHIAGSKNQWPALHPAGRYNKKQHGQGTQEPLPGKDTNIFSHLRPPVMKIAVSRQTAPHE